MARTLLLLAPAVIFPLQSSSQLAPWTGPDKAVYVVTRNTYAEGHTENGPTAKFGELILIEVYNPQPHSDPRDAYQVGQTRHLFRGGQSAGAIKVERVVPLQCNSFMGVVSIEDGAEFSDDAMGLATDVEAVRSHKSSQRSATASEFQHAKQLAMAEFRKFGVSNSAMTGIQTDRLFATELVEGSRFLVGTLSVTAGDIRHDAFLISKLPDAQPELMLHSS